jgi:hypothetical protein
MAVPSGSNFPSSLDDDTTLFGDAVNQASFTLDGDIGTSDTSFNVNEVITGVEVPVFLVFSTGEIVYAEASTPASKLFSSVTRNVDGSGSQSHLDGEEMRLSVMAQHLNQHKEAIVAVETALGASLANVMLDGEPVAKSNGELTINTSDTVTITVSGHYTIDTNGEGSYDELDTISGGTTGDIIIISAESAARQVQVKHQTGNIFLQGGQDLPLLELTQMLVLWYDGTDWIELSGGADRLAVWGGILSGGSAVIQADTYVDVPYVPKINLMGIYATADQSGSVTVSVRNKGSFGIPATGDEIESVVITTAQTYSDTTLTGVTREQAAGTWSFYVESAATSTQQLSIVCFGLKI